VSRNPLTTSYLRLRYPVIIPVRDTYPESMMQSAEITSWKPTSRYRSPAAARITSGFQSSEHNLMEASTRRCPGGERLRRYSSVTVWRGVCLTHQMRHKRDVKEVQALTQKFADAFASEWARRRK